ncbi:Sua5/YciO/YrdC/YwlC family protein [Patescibacteria group bacterium]|nr:Sua5/YciO/YrdC/YwlC family protein [Patescibacteria group bacterium]
MVILRLRSASHYPVVFYKEGLKYAGLIPTDTIYGLSCLASTQENEEKIYEIKQRDYDKPFIILISNIKDLQEFEIPLAKDEKETLKNTGQDLSV